MRNLIERIRGLEPRAWDVVIVVVVLAVCIPEGIVLSEGDGSKLAESAFAVVMSVSLLWRRTRPLIPVVIAVAYFVTTGALEPDLFNRLTSPFLVLMVLLFALGRYVPERPAIAGAVALVVATTIASFLSDSFDSPAQILWVVVLGMGPFFTGRTVGRRTEMQMQLLEKTAELERDRELVAQRAVGDERARIAGELQAVVANGVSAMVVQAEGIPRVLAAGDDGRAEHAFSLIEETGRDALVEMRRLLGVLRRDDESPSLAPLPTLAEVERLAEGTREDGLGVAIAFEGERPRIPPGADLAAYRVLEEALDAAGAAGARTAAVTLGFDPEELRIEIRDDRPEVTVDPAPLLAMRERLGLYGGRVRAGGEEGQGHRVVARLPLRGVVA